MIGTIKKVSSYNDDKYFFNLYKSYYFFVTKGYPFVETVLHNIKVYYYLILHFYRNRSQNKE